MTFIKNNALGTKKTVKISIFFHHRCCDGRPVGLGHQIANLVTRVQIPAVALFLFFHVTFFLTFIIPSLLVGIHGVIFFGSE